VGGEGEIKIIAPEMNEISEGNGTNITSENNFCELWQ
jgi:hypothetical protein